MSLLVLSYLGLLFVKILSVWTKTKKLYCPCLSRLNCSFLQNSDYLEIKIMTVYAQWHFSMLGVGEGRGVGGGVDASSNSGLLADESGGDSRSSVMAGTSWDGVVSSCWWGPSKMVGNSWSELLGTITSLWYGLVSIHLWLGTIKGVLQG